MRYVHDGKFLKFKQSIGIEKIDDNHYCIIYAYCSPKEQYSKKKAREVIASKLEKAIKQMDPTKDCSIVVHDLDGKHIIDSIIASESYFSVLIYSAFFPANIVLALSKHSDIKPFEHIDFNKMESKELKQIALEIRKYLSTNFF